MALRVAVLADPGAERPAPGTPLRVELRDTSLADAPARTLHVAEARVEPGEDPLLATVVLPDAPPGATVWARAAASGEDRVSRGDWVTTAAHPVPSPEEAPARLEITVKPVR